jgi:uncharacterized protein (TIGR02588 family)
MSEDEQDRHRRTAPEWITFVVSVLILAALVGAIVRDLAAPEQPADPVASVSGEPRKVGDQHVVTVEVHNRGDATALQVQVLVTLTMGDDEVDAEQNIEQLAGDAKEELEFVFPDDPKNGELEVRVGGFQHP